MPWNGNVTGSSVNSTAEAHGPKEMDRVNRYHNDVDLEALVGDGSISTVRTKTRFRNNKLQFISDDGYVFTIVVPSVSNDKTITLPNDNGIIALGGGGTPISTITNLGVGGVGVFKAAGSGNADFYSLASISSAIDIALDVGNNLIEFDLDQSAINLSALAGTLPISKGGTGQTSKTNAFDALAPTTLSGDMIYRNASGDNVRLPIGPNGYVLGIVSGVPTWIPAPAGGGGGGGVSAITLHRNASVVDVVSTSSETNIFSFTVPANTIGTTGIVRIIVMGSYLNNSGSDDSYDLRLKLGGTTIWHDDSGTQTSSSNRRPVYIELYIKNNNSASSQRVGGTFVNGNAVLADVGISDISDDELRGESPISASASINTAADQILAFTVDHADSSSNISFQADIVSVELIGGTGGGGTGDVTGATNQGTGVGIFKDETSGNLNFKSLIAGANITITPGTDDITIASTGGGGGSAAGAAGNIQYNSGSATFAAEAALTYDDVNDELTVPGLTINQDLRLNGEINPPQITANQNDYNPTNLAISTRVRLTSDASRNITGLNASTDGRFIIINNVGSFPIVLKNEDAASSAANRFTLGGADLTLAAGKSAALIYDLASARWLLISTAGVLAAHKDTHKSGGTDAFVKGDVIVAEPQYFNPQTSDPAADSRRVWIGGAAGAGPLRFWDNQGSPVKHTVIDDQTNASGDLTGTYPGPTVTSNAITNSKAADMATNTVKANNTGSTADPVDLAVPVNTVVGRKGANIVAETIDTAQISADAVTYAKIQNVTVTDRLLGRDTAAAGDIEELTVGGGVEFTGSGGIQSSAYTGDVTKTAGGTATTIANDAVSNVKAANMAANTVKANNTNASADPTDLAVGASTVVGRGSTGDIVAAAIETSQVSNDAITYAKIQNVTNTDRLLGRDTAAAGDIEELTVGGGLEFTGSGGIQRSALTGDVAASAGSGSTTIGNDAVSNVKAANMAANTIKGNNTNATADPTDIAVGTNTVLGRQGSDIVSAQVVTAQVADGAILYAKMQDVSATDRVLGRKTAGAGDVEELTPTQLTTLIDTFTSGLKGAVPASGGGTTNFLRADGTFAPPPGAGGGEANTSSNAGTGGVGITLAKSGIDLPFKSIAAGSNKITVTDDATDKNVDIDVAEANLSLGNIGGTIGTSQITDDAVTFAKLQNLTDNRLLGRNAGSSGDTQEISLGRGLRMVSQVLDYDFIENVTNDIMILEKFHHQAANAANLYRTGVSGTAAAINLTRDGRWVGRAEFVTGSTATGVASLLLDDTTKQFTFIFGQGEITGIFPINIPALSTAAQEFDLRIGFGDTTTTADYVDGVYFEYDRNSSTNWRICASNNSVRTKTNSSIAVVAGQDVTLKIVVNAAGNSAEFFVDGVSAGTVTTNIPTTTGGTRDCSAGGQLVKSAGTTSVNTFLYLIGVLYKRATPFVN